MALILSIEGVKDMIARENFLKISEFVRDENLLLSGFKFYEIIFTQAETNKKIPHRLGFTPKDVLQTSLIGDGAINWNYTLFDKEFLDVSTSDACTVRAFIGSYAPTGA